VIVALRALGLGTTGTDRGIFFHWLFFGISAQAGSRVLRAGAVAGGYCPPIEEKCVTPILN
jgi:hypothetical protein